MTRATLVVIAVFSIPILLMQFGCEGQNRVEIVTKTVEKAGGGVVSVSGRAREVQDFQQKVSELRSWAADARRWFDRYEQSKHSLESAAADKSLRDLRSACNQIVAACEQERNRPDVREVNGAGAVLDDYEAFANKMLNDVKDK